MRKSNVTKIKMTFDNSEVTAELSNNPTSQDFISMLPLTLDFKDYSGTEKIANPPRKLSTKSAPAGCTPQKGDITLYAPWGNLAIFYNDFCYASGLVPMGHICTGLKELSKLNNTEVKIEVIE
ncbi:cyclophilin-like fold protein [Pectinatus brassicae]|uniref:Cyclophilin-like domain-containing protein n=1 Tax=Pectinatus brassicae TaxID=862415 RepID=A0A840UM33_9FIRM|nr:cyclophilin-like fold protein [Pectinatus brassicae]MBB5337260.1 hypothetical protein [Pectinatus brassicae]